MLNKKDFLKYASKLAFPIMIQNLIGTLVNVADTVMLGYVKPDCHVSFISCQPVHIYSFLFVLWHGYRYFGFMCPVLGKG